MDFAENSRRFQFVQARLEAGVENCAGHAGGCDPGLVGALLIRKALELIEDFFGIAVRVMDKRRGNGLAALEPHAVLIRLRQC